VSGTLRSASAHVPPVRNPCSDLGAGKAVRKDVKHFCGKLRIERQNDRAYRFAMARARGAADCG